MNEHEKAALEAKAELAEAQQEIADLRTAEDRWQTLANLRQQRINELEQALRRIANLDPMNRHVRAGDMAIGIAEDALAKKPTVEGGE